MGVNTPAWSVVIAGLEHPDSPYSVAEYKNMVGRAGRLGYRIVDERLLSLYERLHRAGYDGNQV